MAMNIWANSGAKVRYTNPAQARGDRVTFAKKYLIEGAEYTVAHISVGSSGAFVTLVEVPQLSWPHAMFEDSAS